MTEILADTDGALDKNKFQLSIASFRARQGVKTKYQDKCHLLGQDTVMVAVLIQDIRTSRGLHLHTSHLSGKEYLGWTKTHFPSLRTRCENLNFFLNWSLFIGAANSLRSLTEDLNFGCPFKAGTAVSKWMNMLTMFIRATVYITLNNT